MAGPNPITDYVAKGYRYKETMPTKLQTADIKSVASIIPLAKSFGMPDVSAKDLLDRILVEGRGDAGVNTFDRNNPKASIMYLDLLGQGADKLGAAFAAAVTEKSQVAKRLGISFDEAWNGTGKAPQGNTGKDYEARSAKMKGAAEDPRNADLLNFVQKALSGSLTDKEKLAADSSSDIVSKVFGAAPESAEYMYSRKTPFSAAFMEELQKVQGKQKGLIRRPEDSVSKRDADNYTINTIDPGVWENDARAVVAATVRSNVGIKNPNDDRLRASAAFNSDLQTVIQKLAEQTAKSLNLSYDKP